MVCWIRGVALPWTIVAVGCHAELGECEKSLRVCDIGEPDCQEHVFVQTACAREFDGREVPTVRSITRDEFEDELRGDEEPTAEERRGDVQFATAERMLRLLAPGETSSEDASIDTYARSVLAYYSHVDGTVTIVETNLADADDESQTFVLSHEFVHAQQDDQIGLQEYLETYSTSGDADTAVRSLVEGEAMLFANLTMARQAGASITKSAFEAYFSAMIDDLRDDAARIEQADSTALRSKFPYPFGGVLVTAEYYRDGPQGVLDMYDDPPLSTAAILRTLAHEDPANSLDIPALSVGELPEGWTILDEDTLGAWIVYAVALRNGIDEQTSDALARDWTGDHLLVAGGPTDADVAVAWTVRFASSNPAAQFVAIADASPSEGVRSIEQDGNDVRIVLAADDAALTLWQATFEHAFVDRGPTITARRRGAGGRRGVVPRRVRPIR